MFPDELKRKAELMLQQPTMYGLDEYPEVINGLASNGDRRLADELQAEYKNQIKEREADPDSQFVSGLMNM